MKHLLLALLFVFSIAATASAQGVRFDSQVSQQATVGVTTNVVTIPQSPVISVCASPANAVPCTNKATTYTDSTLGTPCSTSTQIVLSGTSTCVTSPDAQNNWGVWVSAGQYTYTITYGGMNYGPYFFTAGIAGGNLTPPVTITSTADNRVSLTSTSTNLTTGSAFNWGVKGVANMGAGATGGGIAIYGVCNSSQSGVASSTFCAGMEADSYFSPPTSLTLGGIQTASYSDPFNLGPGTVTTMTGHWSNPSTQPGATTTNTYGYYTNPACQNTAVCHNIYGYFAAAPQPNFGDTFNAAYYAADQSGNASAYSFYSAGGKNAFLNGGVFTNTQMNEYLQSLVNSINLTTENVAIYGSNYATDGISGGVLVGAGSTVQRVDGIAGYVHTSSTTTAAVGSYGQARCIANSTLCWGANFVVQAESGITTPSVIGLEVDLNNRTGTDATDGQTNPEDGIRVVNGSTNRGRRGIWINSSTASWQEAATLSNYHTFGLNVGNGDSGSVAAQFIPPDDTSATELIGRNNANAATVWSILNNGTINTPNLNVPDGSGVSGGVLAGSQTTAANSNSVGVLFHSRDSGNVVRSGQLYQPSTNSGSWNYALPNATGILSEAVIEYCGATTGGTQACAKTPQALPLMVWGDVQLNTATSQSITTLPFTDALYSCSGSDLTTAAGIVSFNTYASASVTIVETGGANTDHLRYQCIGH